MALMFPNIVAVPSCAKRHGKGGISGGRVSGSEPLLEPWHAGMAQKAVKANQQRRCEACLIARVVNVRGWCASCKWACHAHTLSMC